MNLLNELKNVGRDCTGCSLCANVCPVKAVMMSADNNGFYKPVIKSDICIDCQQCKSRCPQINDIRNDNFKEPLCYAVKADEDTLEVSASGGAFSILADYVFEKGGYVCGAAYDDDFMGVSHIMISDKNELYRLRGSKYVYSKPGTIYDQVKEALDDDKYVLFSGLPCQVAALNSYLSIPYEKLITVDLLCGGIPSEYVYRKYMEDISDGKKIYSVDFRPKKYGWELSGIETVFEDGSVHMIHSVRDQYFKGFLNNLFKSDACGKCKFSLFPRKGDFTIGDFWSINKYDENIKTDKGISCILPNNKKARKVFNFISSKFDYLRDVPLSFLTSHNQVYEKRKVALAKSRFFNLLRSGWSFKKAVDYSLNWRFDIGLTGCWTVRNYGGEITYYAFYNVLKEMGYTVLMIERRIDIPNYDIPNPILFKNNPYPFYDVCRIHKNFSDQSELNERVKAFILGSDQVWNYSLMGEESIDSYSLDYVKPFRKKIAYAASFGGNKFIGTEEQKKKFEEKISSFNHISVREKAGVEICDEMDQRSDWVLDPIFLCNKKVLFDLVKNCDSIITKQNYLFSYLIWPNASKFGLDDISRLIELDDYVCVVNADKKTLDKVKFSRETWPYKFEEKCCLEQWLYYLMNSSFVVTDSFHAICLSLIFHKPFVFIKGHMTPENGLTRITDLLELVGLTQLISNSVYDAIEKKQYIQDIDWSVVDERLNSEIERSRNWLRHAIESPIEIKDTENM